MNMDLLKQYELIEDKDIEDIKTSGTVLKHKKTGARVIIMKNDDENKVFCIGFKTPPSDNTGVAHILEHSVLCGSKEFPSKEPFVELAKGSLNTFLNAMTYSDKTIYPIASCNDKDFHNLMHVYLDAVFYPNIYHKQEIFMQEGWHYDLENEDAPLKYNGVVYNEMKGSYSSPERLLFDKIQQSLFPDNTYSKSSGGDPEYIPELTYEDFLDFHKKYYHPSNSYIYLYGNVDFEEKLTWIDEHYLSKFEELNVDSTIDFQEPFEQTREQQEYYPISNNEPEQDNTYLSYNLVIGTSLDKELYLAIQVLEYALLSSPGAPLKQALIEAKVGKDILSSYDNGINQPLLTIIAKNSEASKKDEFIQIIKETLKDIVNNGIDKKSLKAAINYFEFRYREADFGRYPKGLMYGIQIFDSWLYDENKPFIHIEALKTFEFLKDNIDTNYFEKLIEKEILNNTHNSIVIVKPKRGLSTEADNLTKEKLAKYKESLSKEDIKKLIYDTKRLLKYQQEPSTKEDLETIPLLNREDINKKIQPLYIKEIDINNTKLIFHEIPTNGIGYIKLLFKMDNVPMELIPYISIFTTVLGYVDTKNYKFGELSNEININTGGMWTSMDIFSDKCNADKPLAHVNVDTKVLYNNTQKAFDLIKEILFNSKLDDEKRLYEIIAELKSRLQMRLNSSGHTAAVERALSYCSKNSNYYELTHGISYYKLIEDLEANFNDRKETLIKSLKGLLEYIIKKENLIVSYTSDTEGYNSFEEELGKFINELKEETNKVNKQEFTPVQLNEGFMNSGKVQYVARAGNFAKAGLKYTGALNVLNTILGYDYLWNNVRVQGGAYGCMCRFSRDGNSYIVSYRDPNLRETNTIFEKAVEYVENFTADERDMTKYIIGTISNMDTPLNPSAKGFRSFYTYMSNISAEDLQRERDEVLNVTEDKIRELSAIVKALIDSGNICVVGNEEKIEENKDLFKTLCELFN